MAISRELLDEEAIEAALRSVEWHRDGKWISRALRFASFREAIAFVGALAEIAESINHHPDIDIRWRTVNLRVTTHSEGGLTQFDFELARRIDALALEHGARPAVNTTP